MFGYGFPQELQDAIDAATAKFGPIECAKKFLFYFMTESGVHDGEVWDCLAELSESSYSDPQYIAKVEQLTDKYSEDAYSDERLEPADITLVVHISVMEGIYDGLKSPIEEFPYNACYDAVNNDWDFDRITESIQKL